MDHHRACALLMLLGITTHGGKKIADRGAKTCPESEATVEANHLGDRQYPGHQHTTQDLLGTRRISDIPYTWYKKRYRSTQRKPNTSPLRPETSIKDITLLLSICSCFFSSCAVSPLTVYRHMVSPSASDGTLGSGVFSQSTKAFCHSTKR